MNCRWHYGAVILSRHRRSVPSGLDLRTRVRIGILFANEPCFVFQYGWCWFVFWDREESVCRFRLQWSCRQVRVRDCVAFNFLVAGTSWGNACLFVNKRWNVKCEVDAKLRQSSTSWNTNNRARIWGLGCHFAWPSKSRQCFSVSFLVVDSHFISDCPFQPLHETDTWGPAVLPRKQHHPSRHETALRFASQQREFCSSQIGRLWRGNTTTSIRLYPWRWVFCDISRFSCRVWEMWLWNISPTSLEIPAMNEARNQATGYHHLPRFRGSAACLGIFLRGLEVTRKNMPTGKCGFVQITLNSKTRDFGQCRWHLERHPRVNLNRPRVDHK